MVKLELTHEELLHLIVSVRQRVDRLHALGDEHQGQPELLNYYRGKAEDFGRLQRKLQGAL